MYIILIYLVGLWPLNFKQINDVRWLSGENGILLNKEGLENKFSDRGIVYSANIIKWPTEKSSNSYSIEIWLKPLESKDRRLEVILSIYDNQKYERIRLERWRHHLIIEARDDKKSGYNKMGVRDVFLPGQEVFITISIASRTITLYVNGELKKEITDWPIDQNKGNNLGWIVMGADSAGGSPWWGEIHGLALYSDTLDAIEIINNYICWHSGNIEKLSEYNDLVSLYSFDEGGGDLINDHTANHNDITIPHTYKTLTHKFLTLPDEYFKLDKSFLSDVIINLAGFIPLGFLLISFLPKKALLQKWFLILIIVASVSFFVSLSIEYLQIYLPQRSSSAIDLIVNTLGGIIGVVLYYSTKPMITTL